MIWQGHAAPPQLESEMGGRVPGELEVHPSLLGLTPSSYSSASMNGFALKSQRPKAVGHRVWNPECVRNVITSGNALVTRHYLKGNMATWFPGLAPPALPSVSLLTSQWCSELAFDTCIRDLRSILI